MWKCQRNTKQSEVIFTTKLTSTGLRCLATCIRIDAYVHRRPQPWAYKTTVSPSSSTTETSELCIGTGLVSYMNPLWGSKQGQSLPTWIQQQDQALELNDMHHFFPSGC